MFLTSKSKFQNLLPFVFMFFSAEVFSGEILNEKKVKLLIIGSTVFATHLRKDFEFKIYFDADGKTAYREQNGEKVKTTYKFEGNKHCIYWRDKDRCASIQDLGNGAYARVNENGENFINWNKIVKGNKLN